MGNKSFRLPDNNVPYSTVMPTAVPSSSFPSFTTTTIDPPPFNPYAAANPGATYSKLGSDPSTQSSLRESFPASREYGKAPPTGSGVSRGGGRASTGLHSFPSMPSIPGYRASRPSSSSESSSTSKDDTPPLGTNSQKDKRNYRKTKQPPSSCHACLVQSTPEWRKASLVYFFLINQTQSDLMVKGPTGLRTLCNACGLQWGKQFPRGASNQQEAEQQLMLLAEARRTRRWNPPSVSQSPQQPNDAAAAASATLPAIQPTNRQLTASKSSGSLLGQMPFTTMTTPTDPAMAFDQGLQGLQLSSPLFPPHNYLAYQQQVYSVPSYGEVSPATYSFAGQTGAPSASASSKDRNFAAPYYQTTSSSGSLQPTSGSDVYNRGAGRSSSGSFQQVSQSDPRSLSRAKSMAALGGSNPNKNFGQYTSFGPTAKAVGPGSSNSTFTMPSFRASPYGPP